MIKHLTSLIIYLLLFVSTAQAHFVLDAKTRVIHLIPPQQLATIQTPLHPAKVQSVTDNKSSGLYLALRIPAPLIYAQALAKRSHPQQQVDAPFLREQLVNGVRYYHLDVANIQDNPKAFADFALSGYRVTADGQTITAQPAALSVHDNRYRPHFNALDGILTSINNWQLIGDYYVGESVVDVIAWLPNLSASSEVAISSRLPTLVLPSNVNLVNMGYDHRQQPVLTQQHSGQLAQAMHFDGRHSSNFIHYIKQGVEHILIGLDHVIFVLCLVVASGFSRQIIWSVTGFTLGHSVTFALGALGIYPRVDWFVPSIELIIAASIIVAAMLVFIKQQTLARSSRRLFLLTAVIGLLHGYGFAFVFSELVGDVQTQIFALLGFNLGVEIGQLLIVAMALLVLLLLTKIHQSIATFSRYATACAAIAIASWWIIERSQVLISMNS